MKNKVLLLVDADNLNELIKRNGFDEEFIADIEREKADAEAYLRDALEAQASKLLIEITAKCKETTEALIEEVKKELAEEILTATT